MPAFWLLRFVVAVFALLAGIGLMLYAIGVFLGLADPDESWILWFAAGIAVSGVGDEMLERLDPEARR